MGGDPAPPPHTEGGTIRVNNEERRADRRYLTAENFVRITKEVCNFPTFFNGPLYRRILMLWNEREGVKEVEEEGEKEDDSEHITFQMFRWYWRQEMEEYDASERFFCLLKRPDRDFIGRDDFLPYVKELLNDHPVSYVVPVVGVCFQLCMSDQFTARTLFFEGSSN